MQLNRWFRARSRVALHLCWGSFPAPILLFLGCASGGGLTDLSWQEQPPVEDILYWAKPDGDVDGFVDQARAAGIAPRRRVKVSTTRELLAALRSNTMIVLAPGRYVFNDSDKLADLTDRKERRPGLEDYTGLSAHYDDGTIHDLRNVAFVSAGPEPAVLVQRDSYAPALSFAQIDGLGLYNLVIGHRTDPGECLGNVLQIVHSRNVLVVGSTLFGSGTEGLSLVGVAEMTLRDSVITDSNQQISTISGSTGVRYERVHIAGNANDDELMLGLAINRSQVHLSETRIEDNGPLGERISDSYGEWFVVDGSFDFAEWYVDDPQPSDPNRTVSTVTLDRVWLDGELLTEALP
jgi:hypothetical protein